jgi:hypothetical protein
MNSIRTNTYKKTRIKKRERKEKNKEKKEINEGWAKEMGTEEERKKEGKDGKK